MENNNILTCCDLTIYSAIFDSRISINVFYGVKLTNIFKISYVIEKINNYKFTRSFNSYIKSDI